MARQKVMQQCPQHTYIDPRSHGLTEPKEYTKFDLDAVENCDVIFAYMSKDNPSGYGLSLEIGYAKCFNHLYGDNAIIMVDEQNKDNMAIVRCCANYLFDNLEDGIKKLNEIGSEFE